MPKTNVNKLYTLLIIIVPNNNNNNKSTCFASALYNYSNYLAFFKNDIPRAYFILYYNL